MKSILLSGGINVFVNNEEWELLEKYKDQLIDRKKLKERQAFIADKLHRRGVLKIKKENNNVFYKLNKNGFI
jgi:hypothetical protein